MSILEEISAEVRNVRATWHAVAERAARSIGPDPIIALTRDFPAYLFTYEQDFISQEPGHGAWAIHAVARAGADGPPIYAVVRRTEDEMRKALRDQP